MHLILIRPVSCLGQTWHSETGAHGPEAEFPFPQVHIWTNGVRGKAISYGKGIADDLLQEIIRNWKCKDYDFKNSRFIYRGLPCGIYYGGRVKGVIEGRYLVMSPGIHFDITPYAPVVPGAEHWFDVQGRFPPSDSVPQTIESIESGPFKTDGELLDTVWLNNKSLREIFDTEYDDGAVCCGMFDG
jgi:hypothetical protein